MAQHYISHTSKTFAISSTDEAQTHTWCVVVPALAVTSTAVRRGMLSLAACCMYTHASRDTEEEEKAALLRVAYSHYNACLRDSGPQLQKLDQAEHVDSIVITTRMLFALGLAFCQIERRLGKSLADSECWAWIPLLRGSAAVQDSIESSGREDQAALLGQDMEHEMVPQKPYVSYDRSSADRLDPPPVLEFLRRARLSSLFSLREVLAEKRGDLSDQRYSQYNQAIDLLDEVLNYTCIFPRIRSFMRVVFTWPTKIPQEFSEALSLGDKFALIIYAHWLMLTVLLRDLWIVDDMGRAGIFEIVARSGEWSEQEQELLVWPKRLLSASI